jgi:hypothetical protein
MTTVFWVHKVELLVAFIDRGDTVTAERHFRTPQRLWHAICRKTLRLLLQGVTTLHDNARPHAANQTWVWIWRYCWEVMDHPPYSPDLIPSNFHKAQV